MIRNTWLCLMLLWSGFFMHNTHWHCYTFLTIVLIASTVLSIALRVCGLIYVRFGFWNTVLTLLYVLIMWQHLAWCNVLPVWSNFTIIVTVSSPSFQNRYFCCLDVVCCCSNSCNHGCFACLQTKWRHKPRRSDQPSRQVSVSFVSLYFMGSTAV